MTAVSKYVVAALTGTVVLAFSAASASAAYACAGNVCWIAKEKYTYPTESKVVIREETWKPSTDITIREAGPGRGYYKGTVWTTW
jgi:hypothetical protein